MTTDLYILIAKKLSGELTPAEEKQFEHWISSDVQNRALFNEAEKIWETSGILNRDFMPDTVQAWEKIQSRIAAPKVIRMQSSRNTWMKVAASVILVLTFSFLLRYALNDRKGSDAP